MFQVTLNNENKNRKDGVQYKVKQNEVKIDLIKRNVKEISE
jgi:hypothetical protein